MRIRPYFFLIAVGFVLPVRASSSAEALQTPPNFEVHWRETPLPAFDGDELASPLSQFVPDDPSSSWQVYVASPQDEPRLLYETPRLLSEPEWDDNGTAVKVEMKSVGMPRGRPANQEPASLQGHVRIEIDGPARDETLLNYTQPNWSRDGRSVAFTLGGQEIYVRTPGLADRGLIVGYRRFEILGWTPDASALLLAEFTLSGANDGMGVYLVPVVDGEARYVFDRADHMTASWSHDGEMLAYTLDNKVFKYDMRTEKSTFLLAFDSRVVAPEWSDDDSILIIRGDLIDVATGRRIVRLMEPGVVLGHSLSKDGRYFITSDYTMGAENLCPREPRQNRTYLYDSSTTQTTRVHECDGTVTSPGPGTLVDAAGRERAILYRSPCHECAIDKRAVDAISLEDGSSISVELDQGYAAISSDSTRLLIGGTSLKLYSADLSLLREYPLPAAKRVFGISWSPVAQRFVYVLGPAGFRQGL